ncbi:MAG TPA: lysophospholipid acyltransferase family protein [Rectinemataceae bacterium]
MNLLIVALLLSTFSYWEFLLLFSRAVLSKEKALKSLLKYERKAIQAIFLLFRRYRGFEPVSEGLAPSSFPERFLLVANHQSLLDIPVLMYLMPGDKRSRFVAKRELAWGIPLISLLLRKAGHGLVKRKGDALNAMRSVTAMAKRCASEGYIPVIFPEGTRSRTGELGSFHSAGYRKILEVEALPILVAAVEGGRHVVTLKDFFRNFGKSPYRVRFVSILPPPKGRREALDILAQARNLIAGALKEMGGV